MNSVTSDAIRALVNTPVSSEVDHIAVLKQLESMGIAWHVTEQGSLMIRYWQVGAESFAPPERVAHINSQHQVPDGESELEWISLHLDELKKLFAGQWIAVQDDKVVAHASDLPGLLAAIDSVQVDRPLVTQIPAVDTVWTTSFSTES